VLCGPTMETAGICLTIPGLKSQAIATNQERAWTGGEDTTGEMIRLAY
jgi:hypothetical protein